MNKANGHECKGITINGNPVDGLTLSYTRLRDRSQDPPRDLFWGGVGPGELKGATFGCTKVANIEVQRGEGDEVVTDYIDGVLFDADGHFVARSIRFAGVAA